MKVPSRQEAGEPSSSTPREQQAPLPLVPTWLAAFCHLHGLGPKHPEQLQGPGLLCLAGSRTHPQVGSRGGFQDKGIVGIQRASLGHHLGG